VSLEVKHGKAADVAESVNVDSKLAEKVDDSWRARGQREPKDERRQHDAGKFRRESDRLHREKLAELRVYGLGMQLLPPLVWKVVRVLDDSLHKYFRVEYPVLFGDHATRNRKDTTEDGKVEEDRAMGSNLEMDEKVGVDDGGEKKDGSKGASHESRESGYCVNSRNNICDGVSPHDDR
jgi:hypothetical protein